LHPKGGDASACLIVRLSVIRRSPITQITKAMPWPQMTQKTQIKMPKAG
jgi:hypothetical protein